MIKLSLLIPSTVDRQQMFNVLIVNLSVQIEKNNSKDSVEILYDIDNYEKSVGFKRQSLIEKAKGEYVVFIDSDDEVSDDYIYEILKALERNPDAVGFEGYITENGGEMIHWKISKDLPYTTGISNGKKVYLRFNNHLSPIKKSIALQIGFNDLRFAEDYDFALRLHQSGLIKTEVYIPKELYHYKYIKKIIKA